MNILFHCSEYPILNKSGGIGTATKIVAEELVRRGHKIIVAGYYPAMKEKQRIETINGVYIYMFNFGLHNGKLKSWFVRLLNKYNLVGAIANKELKWYENKLDDLIHQYNIQLLELTDFYSFNNYRTKLKYKYFNIPVVIRAHGCVSFVASFSNHFSQYAFENDKHHFMRANCLCSVSNYSQKYIDDLFKFNHFNNKSVIFNPIEDAFLKHNKSNETKTILFVGKIIETKGAFAVIKAFNLIAKDFPDWKLILIGKGDIEKAKTHIDAEIKANVVFLGFCDRQTIMKEIDNCAFACIPSFFENFSMVPLEIMGRNRAVIYTKRTSGSEIIEDNVDGFLVDPNNISEIYEKMRTLINNVDLRNTFAERGYKKVSSKFNTATIVTELENFYELCLHS